MESRTRRNFLRKTAGALTAGGAASLAGCGDTDSNDDDYTSDTSTSDGDTENTDQEPKLKGVDLYLSADSKADFTQNENYALGLEAKLQYSDGSKETKEDIEYEVENLEVRKTSEDGKYEVVNIDKNTVPNTKFTDEDLEKAGHYQELEDIQIQDGQIILQSDDLITGYSQIDLDINIEDEEISQNTETQEYNETLEVLKPEKEMIKDLEVTGPEAIELWQKYREHRAEQILEDQIIAPSDRFENYDEFTEVVRERVKERLDRYDNPTIQDELGEWGTEFGRLYMEERNGARPSGGTTELAHILASTDFQTSSRNGMAGVISSRGHNTNPFYVPGSNDPEDKEYWEGKTFNVNTALEEAAHPPVTLSDIEFGPYGLVFKNPEDNPGLATATFDSFMHLNQEIEEKGQSMIDEDYAVSLAPELGDDTEVWHDNLKHIMETAVGNLFSTENDLIPTGSAGQPEVELK